jgi:hypothetical protein
MAGGDGERRMVFDIRGKRKHVVKFVYAILAILMGSSLFLVVGPVNIGSLFGNNNSTSSAASVLEEQAVHIERKLKKSPEDEALLAALTRTRLNAGNASIVENPTTHTKEVPQEALVQFAKGGEAWEKYLKASGEKPKPLIAQLVATAFFTSAEFAPFGSETERNLEAAAHAQQFAAKAAPTLNSISTLAFDRYFALDFAGGDKSAKQAEALAGSKAEGKSIEKQLNEIRKRAKAYQKQQEEFAKAQKGSGKQALENPLGGLSGGGTSLSP